MFVLTLTMSPSNFWNAANPLLQAMLWILKFRGFLIFSHLFWEPRMHLKCINMVCKATCIYWIKKIYCFSIDLYEFVILDFYSWPSSISHLCMEAQRLLQEHLKNRISWKRSIFFVTHFRKWNPYIILCVYITHRVKYFNPLFLEMLMIMAYR